MMTKTTDLPDRGNPALWSRMVVTFCRGVDGAWAGLGEGIVHWTGYTAAQIKANPELLERLLVLDHEEWAEDTLLKPPEVASGQPARVFCLRHATTGKKRRIGEWGQGPDEGIWLDMSLMERMRERLWNGLWKETLAKLTSGFVHDLNNILAGIGSLTELSLMEMADQDPMRGNLKILKENTYKATRLTEQLSRLLHAKKGQANYHDLNAVVTEVCAFLKPAIPRNIECVRELAAVSLPVHVDGRELQQVICSLIFNGVGAIEGKGRILLRTAVHEKMPPSDLIGGKVLEGDCVSLSVEDSGSGVKPGQMEALAAMDYTTKTGGGGIGLGLAHGAAFCEGAGGALSAERGNGKGGVVVIWLPMADLS